MENIIYSIDSEKCKSCQYYNNCDNKRKELCIAKYLTTSIDIMGADIAMDSMAKHNTITIDLEEIKRKIYKEVGLNCKFFNGDNL